MTRAGAESWAFWDGHVFHREAARPAAARRARAGGGHEPLSSPMPATVRQVLVQPGALVRKGDTLVVLEAMKMELPIRASSDATVSAVRCAEGDLVQAGAILVELR